MADEIKVGDELAFRSKYSDDWRVWEVDRITPSGRIICGPHTLNPDLSVRGSSNYGPYAGQRVTPEIRLQIKRKRLVHHICRVPWSNCSTKLLEQVLQLLKEDA